MGAALALRTDYDGMKLRELARKTKDANPSPQAFGAGGDL